MVLSKSCIISLRTFTESNTKYLFDDILGGRDAGEDQADVDSHGRAEGGVARHRIREAISVATMISTLRKQLTEKSDGQKVAADVVAAVNAPTFVRERIRTARVSEASARSDTLSARTAVPPSQRSVRSDNTGSMGRLDAYLGAADRGSVPVPSLDLRGIGGSGPVRSTRGGAAI